MTGSENIITVETGSRIHFGLTSVAARRPHALGGVGVMIEQPATRVVIAPAQGLTVRGRPQASQLVQMWRSSRGESIEHMDCAVEILESPPAHIGLGSGTQLAMALAAGLNRFFGTKNRQSPADLARSMNRGTRSSIGTYGFFYGGFLVDRVTGDSQSTLELAHRIDVPADWRMVLVRGRDQVGRSGAAEQRAFAALRGADHPNEARLSELIRDDILPSIQRGDFDRFCGAIYGYGRLSGEYYRELQGGIYHGEQTQAIVDAIRQAGFRGVGQSSWGPTVFAWCPNECEARKLHHLITSNWTGKADIWISSVRNRGVAIGERSGCDVSSTKAS